MGALEMGWQMAETKMNLGPYGEGRSGPCQPLCSTFPASPLGLRGLWAARLQGWRVCIQNSPLDYWARASHSSDPPGTLAEPVAHGWSES